MTKQTLTIVHHLVGHFSCQWSVTSDNLNTCSWKCHEILKLLADNLRYIQSCHWRDHDDEMAAIRGRSAHAGLDTNRKNGGFQRIKALIAIISLRHFCFPRWVLFSFGVDFSCKHFCTSIPNWLKTQNRSITVLLFLNHQKWCSVLGVKAKVMYLYSVVIHFETLNGISYDKLIKMLCKI